MIVDGKEIAKEIYASVKAEVALLSRPPIMAAITCAPNFETRKYLELKKRKAEEVGITLRVVELPETATTAEAVACVEAVVSQVDGVVVQLPLPVQIDREAVLAAVPTAKDPDGFSYGIDSGACLPPVVGAIDAIAKKHQVDFKNMHTVVLGQGRLVGAPAARFLRDGGAKVTTLTEADKDNLSALNEADCVVTGIGKPHYVTSDMVKEGVLIFDAGTSEDGGVVVGDVDPAVAQKAYVYTPVPGGIGPLTIAILLQNLVALYTPATK